MSLVSLPPLSLYVHIPWCVRKCPYCDFNSHAAPDQLPERDYVKQLIADLHRDAGLAQGRKLESVFFGGGTPSLFHGESIERVLRAADEMIGFADEVEITLEANPGTVEQQRFRDFRQAGVNRLSIGIQSLHDRQLQALGRVHDRREALQAVEVARKAGFENFNLDSMHGLPRQTLDEALIDLQQVINLGPSHISWYQLTLEPNTVFYSKPPVLPDSEILADVEEQGWALLRESGYGQYEISAYSEEGKESRHNLNYWQFGDYLGIGAGAHGKVTDAADGRVWRSRKTRLPADYLVRELVNNQWSPVPQQDLPLEFMLNCLRLTAGVPASHFEARSGTPLRTLEPRLADLRERELLVSGTERIAATPLGRRFLNDVLATFMPAEEECG